MKTYAILLTVLLAGCTGMPKLSLTPVSVDATVGGQHETGTSEESMVKVQTGDSNTTKYTAEKVEQVYNDVENSPMWLVLAFAFAMGIAIPSPTATYSNWTRRRDLKKQVSTLTEQLNKKA